MQMGWTRSAVLALGLFATAGSALAETKARDVLKTYADIAQAMYGDAHTASLDLQKAVDALIKTPSEATLKAARQAWIDARPWYMHSEPYRFGNPVVDEWEGNVNSWPLDEGLIDYVDAASYGDKSDENPLYTLNVIANKTLKIGKETVDASVITPELLKDKLNGAMSSDANVAVGWHAVEFLLWGQDLNGTGPGAGDRPWTDYSLTQCTHGNCDRRAAYLKVATDLLVSDLGDMAAWWAPGGKARADLEAKDDKAGIGTIFTGLGSLSFGELAGERIKLGLVLHDPEEEHDCFSDDTHHSYLNSERGIIAVWTASYKGRDGKLVTGPSLAQLSAEADPALAAAVDARMAETLQRFVKVQEEGDKPGGQRWDQLIGADNPAGNAMIQGLVDGLVAQTRALEAVIAKLGVEVKVQGSDSLKDVN
ncbi:imelysin family protein [Labrys wisconsinensis]|uniref:Iron-regulated protein n=1 Tax=Labrys wisconsinensis TaxID=425677 RepID=A0ABU0JAH2_9HYPH|nr:imelysin family protein [Labrys wisconsinensis]MDQ0471263.1 putative iron-regulated protein [Labrys wisconsinensis]